MYKFWERRLDGFSDRYVDSCRRLTEQMEKQALSTPHNIMWLVRRIEDYVLGKDGDGKNPQHELLLRSLRTHDTSEESIRLYRTSTYKLSEAAQRLLHKFLFPKLTVSAPHEAPVSF
ncbi:hypothetical protein GQ600_12457 [Phytophthora cactorum]|nr:hypothetical protein GQ600_12457 [Phytophthora cactorum]